MLSHMIVYNQTQTDKLLNFPFKYESPLEVERDF